MQLTFKTVVGTRAEADEAAAAEAEADKAAAAPKSWKTGLCGCLQYPYSALTACCCSSCTTGTTRPCHPPRSQCFYTRAL